jgi:hypothetical protein
MTDFLTILVPLLAPLLGADPTRAAAEPRVEAWVGHQVLKGKRKIPIYGEKETHTENFYIAEIRRDEKHIDIRQKTCRIEVQPIKGVTPTMTTNTVLHLPRSHAAFDVTSDGALAAEPWTTGWGEEDVENDDHPGATVHISGSTCSGDVYVSNQSTTKLVAGHASDDGITGEISVRMKQKILGASGLCLKLMAGDSEETQTGWFAYKRIPAGQSCRAMLEHPWPVKAGPPAAARAQSQ